MFRVHILKKAEPYNWGGRVLKAAHLWNKKTQDYHSWPDERIINHDPKGPDLSPFSYEDPETGELGGAMHGMEAAVSDLQKRLDRQGIRAQAEDLIQQSVDLYNSKHPEDSNHKVPDVTSNKWNKSIFGGPGTYQKGAASEERLTRANTTDEEGKRHFVSYHTNAGVPDEAGINHHIFPESASFPMNDELGTILRGIGMAEVNDVPYVTDNHVSVQLMTGHNIVPVYEKESQGMQQGHVSDRLAGEPKEPTNYGKVYSDQVAHMLPDAFYAKHEGNVRGRKAVDGIGKYERYAKEIMDEMSEHGIALSEEEANVMARMPVSDLIMGRVDSIDTKRGGRFGKLLKSAYEATKADASSEDWRMHSSHVEKGDHDTDKGRHSTAKTIFTMAATVGQGVLRNTEVPSSHKFNLHEREAVEGIIKLYSESEGNKHGGEGQKNVADYSVPTEVHPRYNVPAMSTVPEAPEHFRKTGRYHDLHELAPISNTTNTAMPDTHPRPLTDEQTGLFDTRFAGGPPKVSVAPPTPQVRAAHPSELAQRASAHEEFGQWEPQQLHQALGLGGAPPHRAEQMVESYHPDQRFFDPMGGQFVRGESIEHLDAIRKSIEDMQLKDAMSDENVMSMVPNGEYSLDSIIDIGLVAKSLEITSQDVRALHSSSGDWHRIASEWRLSPDIVKAVKVIFQ